MKNPIAVYFESWAAKYTVKAEDFPLSKIEKPITIVNLAFVKPDCEYKKDSCKWDGTGFNFSVSFDIVKKSIQILKKKNIMVMISVGGGSYWNGTKPFNAENCVALMNDLECDGIDIDWEGHAARDYELTECIKKLKAVIGDKKISFAGFSTGAFGKDGDTYKGSAIDAMVKQGSNVDWINIMAYDAGKNFDPIGAFECYQIYYKGPLLLGFEVGKQGWGDAMLTDQETTKSCQAVKLKGDKHGIFIWAYFKKSENETTVDKVLSIASDIFAAAVVSQPSTPSDSQEPPKKKQKAILTCPSCQKDISISTTA